MQPACVMLMKKNNLTCSVTATRVVYDVLSKSHFKIRPLAVEARVYNPLYTTKMRPPENDEEAESWLNEGCWSIVLGDCSKQEVANKWPGHLLAVVNDICIVDLAIVKAYRPDKQIIVNPVFSEINDEWLKGDIQRGVTNNGCLIVYKAIPENQDYMKYNDWMNRKAIEGLERDVIQVMRKNKFIKPVEIRKDSPILKNAKLFALKGGSYDEVAVPATSSAIQGFPTVKGVLAQLPPNKQTQSVPSVMPDSESCGTV